MVNRVILIGRLGQKPVLKYTQSGTAVANFSVATTKRRTDKQGEKVEETCWHRIVCWGKLGELCDRDLDKGSMAYVEGEIVNRSYQDKNGVTKHTSEVHAQEVRFLGSKRQQHDETSGVQEPTHQSEPELPDFLDMM